MTQGLALRSKGQGKLRIRQTCVEYACKRLRRGLDYAV